MAMEVILLYVFCTHRNCFQQWRKMEANPAFLPHGFEEYGNGKEDH